MPQTYSWADERERAAESFGGHYPDAELEQQIMEVFGERPAFVVDAITNIAEGYRAGRVHSPWVLLAKQVTVSPAEMVVSDTRERDKRVAQAQSWIRSAGLYIDREAELIDELFGDRGRLRGFDAERLRAELVGLWRELRPVGEELERQSAERLEAQLVALERVEGRSRRTSRPRNADGSFVSPLDVDDWAAV